MGLIEIPDDHPRKVSLETRETIIEGHQKHIVATAGLLAHGRGEAFDYLIGERTTQQAKEAIQAAVAEILLADHPVISVNGNVCSLVPRELVQFSELTKAPLEINLFYYRKEREDAILKALLDAGAKEILGTHDRPSETIPELSSNRRKVDSDGIAIADVVIVPLEDGDRTEALRAVGKRVITVDLNPMSRTSVFSNVTIVDNIIRAMPLMVETAKRFRSLSEAQLIEIVDKFDNGRNLDASLQIMIEHLQTEAKAALQRKPRTVKELKEADQ
ncbi:MAG: phosphopantothenate/pantothenate synthetase [Candidatus Lokiarchaeota archaeon]|nr:phosphopantothenate/pantothenate synthetase [Candidatus Lokiarchaeota archaeon]